MGCWEGAVQLGESPHTSVRLSGFPSADFRCAVSVKQDLMCQLSDDCFQSYAHLLHKHMDTSVRMSGFPCSDLGSAVSVKHDLIVFIHMCLSQNQISPTVLTFDMLSQLNKFCLLVFDYMNDSQDQIVGLTAVAMSRFW